MKRSLVRTVALGVIGSWLIGFIALFTYARTRRYTEEDARADGAFLAHSLLDELSPEERAARVIELRPNFRIGLTLLNEREAAALLGHALAPSERAFARESFDRQWLLLSFADGGGTLAAGPVHPAKPPGVKFPIGLVLGILALPLLAGWITLRLSRQLAAVERATEALGAGELGTRIEPGGPSAELADAFNTMAERVERLIRSRDELVQAVSHELGSPLSRLRFHLELLGSPKEEGEAETHARVAAMNREIDALDELIAELSHYVEAGDAQLRRGEVELSQVLPDLFDLATLEAPDDHEVRIESGAFEGLRVQADPRLFQRAVENVLRNAVRYARERVRVEARREGDALWLIVHDDGPGVPAEMRERVLEPFVRLEADRGRDSGGSGLGLAIVSRILERHEGEMRFGESAALGGAEVRMAWPRRST